MRLRPVIALLQLCLIPALAQGYPGCTDPNASNYDPGATTDNGSCSYCGPGEVTVVATMTSASGDGWNGANYVLTEAIGGTLIQFGSLDFAQSGDLTTQGQDIFCIASGQDCVTLTVDGPPGSTGGIGWSFALLGGSEVIAGQGRFGPFPMFFGPGSAYCDISGCTDPDCISYNPFAIFPDPEQCVCVEVPGDATVDGTVDADDVLLVLGFYGADTCAWPCAADSDQNGIIDVADLLVVLGGFGTQVP